MVYQTSYDNYVKEQKPCLLCPEKSVKSKIDLLGVSSITKIGYKITRNIGQVSIQETNDLMKNEGFYESSSLNLCWWENAEGKRLRKLIREQCVKKKI